MGQPPVHGVETSPLCRFGGSVFRDNSALNSSYSFTYSKYITISMKMGTGVVRIEYKYNLYIMIDILPLSDGIVFKVAIDQSSKDYPDF